MVWRYKRNVLMLISMHSSPAEGGFCDEYGNTVKPDILEWYNWPMNYVGQEVKMAIIPSAITHGSGQKNSSTHQMLHILTVNILLSCCCDWKSSQRNLSLPSEECDGTYCKTALSTEAIRQVSKYCHCFIKMIVVLSTQGFSRKVGIEEI